MNIWVMFFFGLLLGWLIEWIIDWFFWRRPYRLAENERKQCSERVKALELEIERLNKAQSPAVATVEAPQQTIIPDDLKIIKGIGPVIEKKLNQAGIHTFEQLASLSVERLREILGDAIERLADEESLLQQACRLASHKSR